MENESSKLNISTGILWGVALGILGAVAGLLVGFAFFGLVLFGDTQKAMFLIGTTSLVFFLVFFAWTFLYSRNHWTIGWKSKVVAPVGFIIVEILLGLAGIYGLNVYTQQMYDNSVVTPISRNIGNDSKIPYPKTIEDAVRASGGTYMQIDPNASPVDIADTIESAGLTNSDNQGKNIVLVDGVNVYDTINDTFQVKAYVIEPKQSFKGSIIIHSKNLPLVITLFSEDGRIIDLTRDSITTNGDYKITSSFAAGGRYIVEVFIQAEKIKDFDPNKTYTASYYIGLEKL